MEEKKRRRPRPADPGLDIAGPAAWDETRPAAKPRPRRRPRRPGDPEDQKKAVRAPRGPKIRPKRSLFTRFVIWLLWTGVGLGIAGLAALFGIYAYFSQDLPSTEGLKTYVPPTVTYFYSDDGQVVGEYYHQRRFVKPLDEIPVPVRQAFMAVEDAMFYDHYGINFKSIIRAALANLRGQKEGASTITQQVARNFLLTQERTYTRKIKEMILAFRIEGILSKDEILYLYLNEIYLGRGAYGVEAAARTYFNKPVGELSIAEVAVLAGITQSPGRNPVSDPKQARLRQIHAINRMEVVGFITPEQAKAARDEVLTVYTEWPNPNTEIAPYFTEHVRRLLEDRFGAESLYNDGWKVYTTVNIEAQRAADRAVAQGLWEYGRRRGYRGPVEQLADDAAITAFLARADEGLPQEGLETYHLYQAVIMEADKKNSALSVRVGSYQGRIAKKNLTWALKGDFSQRFHRGDVVWVRLADEDGKKKETPADPASPAEAVRAKGAGTVLEMSLERRTDVQSALLSLDLANGDVKAMVGGRDFGESQFNRAVQSQRQPGSSFKPILYASALDHGFTPGSIMNDAPFVVDDPGSGKRWKPVNSDLKFKGPMSLYTALVGSRNLISIKLLDRIGFEALAQTARDLGITERLPESLTIALGAHGLHMPELVTAYSAFPNMGVRVAPRYITRIEDRHGNVVANFEPELIPALDPGTACAVTWMLRGVVEQGTGTKVKPLGRPVGGKTGTTNDYSDAWFIGFTPELVTAVWVGTDQQRPRAVGEVGGNVAGPIFLYYMRDALKDKPIVDFTVPPEAEVVEGGSPFGVCYKAGTVGTGLSETISSASAEDDFLREDIEEAEDPATAYVDTEMPGGFDGSITPEMAAGREDRGSAFGRGRNLIEEAEREAHQAGRGVDEHFAPQVTPQDLSAPVGAPTSLPVYGGPAQGLPAYGQEPEPGEYDPGAPAQEAAPPAQNIYDQNVFDREDYYGTGN